MHSLQQPSYFLCIIKFWDYTFHLSSPPLEKVKMCTHSVFNPPIKSASGSFSFQMLRKRHGLTFLPKGQFFCSVVFPRVNGKSSTTNLFNSPLGNYKLKAKPTKDMPIWSASPRTSQKAAKFQKPGVLLLKTSFCLFVLLWWKSRFTVTLWSSLNGRQLWPQQLHSTRFPEDDSREGHLCHLGLLLHYPTELYIITMLYWRHSDISIRRQRGKVAKTHTDGRTHVTETEYIPVFLRVCFKAAFS